MEIRKATPADSMTLGTLASRMWEHDPAALAAEFADLTASDEATVRSRIMIYSPARSRGAISWTSSST